MAGRILPIALATVSGVAIGVATWDGELKEQRRQRLEEEYKRDMNAVSALNSEGPSPMASSSISPPAPEQVPTTATESEKTSKLSSYLGFWAWKSSRPPPSPTAQKPSQDQQQQQKS
ncbi:hypothetical protein DM02DRAFT_659138 [Periconia macrospinosa]|uniref:HIG1 domain-containing protein n=1 Tax=Periconia macrospinosa TaxID=97972 RepID=A0A2V1DED9_9PLEO|nr:hypothetical protein DM02DRAFT_659138 [Periconia macrospinosa]